MEKLATRWTHESNAFLLFWRKYVFLNWFIRIKADRWKGKSWHAIEIDLAWSHSTKYSCNWIIIVFFIVITDITNYLQSCQSDGNQSEKRNNTQRKIERHWACIGLFWIHAPVQLQHQLSLYQRPNMINKIRRQKTLHVIWIHNNNSTTICSHLWFEIRPQKLPMTTFFLASHSIHCTHKRIQLGTRD